MRKISKCVLVHSTKNPFLHANIFLHDSEIYRKSEAFNPWKHLRAKMWIIIQMGIRKPLKICFSIKSDVNLIRFAFFQCGLKVVDTRTVEKRKSFLFSIALYIYFILMYFLFWYFIDGDNKNIIRKVEKISSSRLFFCFLTCNYVEMLYPHQQYHYLMLETNNILNAAIKFTFYQKI